MFVLFVGATAMRPVPSVLLRPAAATGPRLQAAILLQQEPGKDGRVIRLPPREAWGALLACQVTIIAAVFGWMVAFAPEQLRVDAERRRTDCVQLPLQPLRGACVPIVENGLLPTEPLRLRGGFCTGPAVAPATTLRAPARPLLALAPPLRAPLRLRGGALSAPHLRRRAALTAAAALSLPSWAAARPRPHLRQPLSPTPTGSPR